MTPQAAVRLIDGWSESCFGIVDVRHLFVGSRFAVVHLIPICARYLLAIPRQLLLLRALDEAAFHAEATIGQALPAIVSNFLVPHAPTPLALEASNDGSSLSRSVNSHSTVLVVDL